MQPLDQTTARGQYTAGWQGSQKVPGLLEEEGFSKDSKTETYAAITLEIDGDKITLDKASPADRQRLLAAFLARHGAE